MHRRASLGQVLGVTMIGLQVREVCVRAHSVLVTAELRL